MRSNSQVGQLIFIF